MSATPRFIKEIAVLQVSQPSSEKDFSKNFGWLQTAFSKAVKVFWLFPSQGAGQWSEFESGGLIVVPVPFADPKRQTNANDLWLQDPFWVLEGESLRFLAYRHQKIGILNALRALTEVCGAQLELTDLPIEGGNIRMLPGKALVGKDLAWSYHLVQASGRSFVENWNEAHKKLADLFSQLEIIWIGTREPQPETGRGQDRVQTFQPFFHLDLFLLPVLSHQFPPRIILGTVPDEWSQDLPGYKDVFEQVTGLFSEAGGALELGLTPFPFRSECFMVPNGFQDGPDILLPDFHPTGRKGNEFYEINAWQQDIERRLESHGIPVKWIKGGFYEQRSRLGALNCRIKIIRHYN